MDRKRRIIQVMTAFIYNANLKGFATGRIYQGKLKGLCVPGLNCYSCPGALGSCPLGSLQALMGSSPVMIPFYVAGLLALFGVLLGRFICGWLCPFGLIQELLNRIPSFKLNVKRGKLVSLKYIILLVFVLAVPAYTYAAKGYVVPAFCKLICPAGTLEAGFPLIASNEGLRGAVGALFAWKALLAIITIIASVIVFRPFCRYICPLGAIYGFFNKISIVRIEYIEERCVKCGKCNNSCKMNLTDNLTGKLEVDSPECIRCGRCVDSCKRKALAYKTSLKQ